MARRSGGRTRLRLRLLGALLLLVLAGGTWGWWHLRHWQPDRASFPVQGVEVGARDGRIDWRALKAIGADFAYIDASASAFARDPAFARNLEEAREVGLQAGAVHRYDPCQPADRQAGNFVTTVPRDAGMLPPAVELDMAGDDCPVPASEASIQSELTTFLNQVETHTGKPVIIKLSRSFQDRYAIAAAIDRNLWLSGDRLEPDYADRPWTMWTANGTLAMEAEPQPLRWVVVQP
jgi:lysozyme